MLVLSRKIGQTIVIADGIQITLLAMKRGSIRLGVTAPRDVEIVRKEVAERKGEEVRTR